MNREQQEMSLWCEAYMLAISQGASYGDADEAATTAAESFRKRYPVEPEPPEPTWYDVPPFAKDGKSHPCWVEGEKLPAGVYFGRDWYVTLNCERYPSPLDGRRVCPIHKPPEPTT